MLTSGGDSPGMNACVRAVVRTAIYKGYEVFGIHHGYEGLIDGDVQKMTRRSVANIILRGGTILKTARSKRFREEEGMKLAAENLKKAGCTNLIVIGGDGTFSGAIELNTKYNVSVIGIPATIDNDISGTDYTIGFDTAINTVVSVVDKIRDTAESHDRLFIIEVMGRTSGMIGLYSGLASGAEAILIPETNTTHEEIIERLRSGRKSKRSRIIIVAEGEKNGGALKLSEKVKSALPEIDTRVSILGHMQRGGAPTTMDRINASMLGFSAVEALCESKTNIMVGMEKGEIIHVPLKQATTRKKIGDTHLLEMMKILAT